MLLWVTDPHLYFGVVTEGLTLTLSLIFICEGELCGGNPGGKSVDRDDPTKLFKAANLNQ